MLVKEMSKVTLVLQTSVVIEFILSSGGQVMYGKRIALDGVETSLPKEEVERVLTLLCSVDATAKVNVVYL